MKKMSYLLLCAAIVFVTACSEDDARKDTLKRNELGLIVPKTGVNTLLLEDGTLAKPVTGIPDFNSRAVGSKLLLTYKPLSVENGITNIAVTAFAEANDSTFTVDPDPQNADSIYSASFSGTYFIVNSDSTETLIGEATFDFGAVQSGTSTYSYSFTPNEGAAVIGSGHFTIDNGLISFEDNDDEDRVVPTGSFRLSLGNGWLYLWRVGDDNAFYSYALQRQ